MIQWLFIFFLVLLVVIFDVWIINKKGKPSSISAVLIRTFRQYPAITAMFFMAIGLVFGHITWSMKTQDIYPNTKCYNTITGEELK